MDELRFSPDGRSLCVVGKGDVLLLETATGGPRSAPLRGQAWFTTAAFLPDGRHLALGDWTGAVHVCDLLTGRRCFHGRGHEGHVDALAVSADGKTLLSGGADGTTMVWDVTKAWQPSR
jgi:WD40 repeat protein